MNISRSKVRQSTLCYLYAYLSNGSQTPDKELFWQMALEKDREHLHTAQAKAVLHTCRSSADTARLLTDRLELVENHMHADLTAAALREEIDRYARQSEWLEAALKALAYCVADKRRETTEQLALCTSDVLRLAAVVEALGRDLVPRFKDFPVYRPQLDALTAAINRRARMLRVCMALAHPLELSGNKEYINMVRIAQDMHELRPAVEDMAARIIARIPLVEPRLEGMLKNYSVERLDLVDKAILYIALYELDETGLDVRIVVSEANALADEYSGSKSAPFIHGVIATAAQK